MNRYILNKNVQDYIKANINANVSQISLSKSPFLEVSSAEIANQINAKKKSEKKLPNWFNADDIYYPSALSIEQTSSEITANYKSNLATGDTLIDLTGGFGVDTFYFAKKIKNVIHCEINLELSQIAERNAKILDTNNITFKPVNGLDFIKNQSTVFDTIFIDPARRAEKGKVFMLKDCTPDVVGNYNLIKEKAKRIIIKTAPLLDISAGLSELKNVSEIHIVSVKNECKELLWVIDNKKIDKTKIIAVTLNEAEKYFSFFLEDINTEVNYANKINIGEYLYEPDVALLKSGAFNLIAKRFDLEKLHQQTQLYTSNSLNDNFPGRIFKIQEILNSNDLKKLNNLCGNVIVRNYPAKPEDLIKKHNIKPDKDLFYIFSKVSNGDNLIFKSKIIQYY